MEAIRQHPIEIVGKKLRIYMTDMKRLKKETSQLIFRRLRDRFVISAALVTKSHTNVCSLG